MLVAGMAALMPVMAFLAAPGSAGAVTTEADSPVTQEQPVTKLKVMTRNLYFGASLDDAVTATNPTQLIAAVTRIFAQVQDNDFPERAQAIAAEIAAREPDLVGLQEVALWRSGPFTPTAPTPATNVEYDFLQILLDALAARGLHYAPVPGGVVTNFDVEAPRCRPGQVPPACLQDIRLTDRDVMLVRTDVPAAQLSVGTAVTDNFDTNLTLPGPGGSPVDITITRGYVFVDATLRGKTVRVINTHLDADSADINVEQARELLAVPANTTLPVVLLGDLNHLLADLTPTDSYDLLTAAGFRDAWDEAHPDQPGLTCCESEDLDQDPPGATPSYNRRIDLVLFRGTGFQAGTVARVGADPADRTPSGLWPSDHAGVFAKLTLP